MWAVPGSASGPGQFPGRDLLRAVGASVLMGLEWLTTAAITVPREGTPGQPLAQARSLPAEAASGW